MSYQVFVQEKAKLTTKGKIGRDEDLVTTVSEP